MNQTDRDFIHRVAQSAHCAEGAIANSFELSEELVLRHEIGDFVECGVFAGSNPAVMAYALQKHGDRSRRVHLFDSFEGIPHASERDDETITSCVGKGHGELVTTGVSACSLDAVRGYLRDWGIDESLLVFHPGWFQHTVERDAQAMGPLALLRLDVDLYDSTMACLPHLYPKLVRGGYYISDDYTLTGARNATVAYLASIGERVQPIEIVGGGGAHYWRR